MVVAGLLADTAMRGKFHTQPWRLGRWPRRPRATDVATAGRGVALKAGLGLGARRVFFFIFQFAFSICHLSFGIY